MIPLLLVFLLISLPVVPLSTGGNLTAIYAEVNCTPTDWYPYYNCNEPLFVILWDVRYPPHYNSTSDTFYINSTNTSLGLATRNISYEPTLNFNYSTYNVISVGNTQQKLGYGDYDSPGMSVFQHEIKHIVCKCSWHPRT